MEYVPKNDILEIASDSMEYIRKEYDLDGPGRMKEAVGILRDWIEKQEHFKKKDFNVFYLETTIFGCKGSIERAKARLDKLFTIRTMMPHFFDFSNMKKALDDASLVLLPKHTEDHYRVCVVKLYPGTFTTNKIRDIFKIGIMTAEYEKVHDYVNGFILILDVMEVELLELVSALNVMELKQAATIFLEGYGMRLRAIHVLSDSKLVDTFTSVIKQVLSNKISSRICLNKTIDDLHRVLPKKILPKDYGGVDLSLKELHRKWSDVIFSEDHMEYLRDMNKAGTDESRRPKDQFTEEYAGVPGTFKLLHID